MIFSKHSSLSFLKQDRILIPPQSLTAHQLLRGNSLNPFLKGQRTLKGRLSLSKIGGEWRFMICMDFVCEEYMWR